MSSSTTPQRLVGSQQVPRASPQQQQQQQQSQQRRVAATTTTTISLTISQQETKNANTSADSLMRLIEEFGKGIDKKRHGNNITRQDVSKKAMLLLTSIDNHLSTVVEQGKALTTRENFDFVKIESVLFKALLSTVTPVDVLSMRRVICSCLKKLYMVDNQMVAKAAPRLITALDSHANLVKDASNYPQIIALSYSIGTLASVACHLMPPFSSVLPILLKLWRLYSDAIKVSVLSLTSAYVLYNKKSIVADWQEYIRMAQRGQVERSSEVRQAAGKVCLIVASQMTPELAQNKLYDAFLAFCAKSMDDPDLETRSAFGSATGEALFRVITPEGPSAPKKMPIKVYTCGYSLILLTASFSKVGSSRELREAICISVIHFLNQCTNEMLETNIEIIVSNLIGLLGNTKAYVTSGDLLQAQMYVSQMIRMGIVNRLDESGRMIALRELIRILERYSSNQYAMMCLIREIASLINLLGEVVENIRDQVLEAILICLRHSTDYVRYAGALCTRTLAAAIPTHTTSLVSALMNMVQMDHAELAMCTSVQEQHRFANSLHGHSNALAALIFISSKHNLAVSHVLCSAVLDTAMLLGKQNGSMSTFVAMRRQEARWVLVCAILSLSDYWVKMNLERIIELWDEAVGSKTTPKLPSDDEQIASVLRSKATALLSLTMFINSCPVLMTAERVNKIYGYFAYTIKLLSTLPPNYKPVSSASLHSIHLIKLYLFELMRKLPSNIFEKPQQKSVVNFVTKLAFAEIDGTRNGVETSLLHTLLLSKAEKEEQNEMYVVDLFDVLIEDGLRYFSKGGQLYFFSQEHPQFQEFTVEPDSSCILDEARQSFFEKPLSLNVRLVDSAIQLLGVLFTYHKPTSKSQIVEYFVSHIKTTYAAPDDTRLSNTVFSNAVASVYCILMGISSSGSKVDESEKSYYAHIHSILNAALGHDSQSIRRGASQTIGLLASLVGSAVMEDLLKRCATKIVKEGPIKSGYALALGDVNKSLGSLASRNHLPQTISFLLALSRSPSISTQISAFQSIWNTIETSGIGFSAHVDSVLQHLVSLFFSPVGIPPEQKLNQHDDKHLLLGSARILCAFIALGPDVIFRPHFVDVFNLLIHDILTSDITTVQIEATRLVERAILLAPMLIPNLKRTVGELKRFLLNAPTHSSLKRITANCIKIIAEKEPDLICATFPPKLLFKVLDQFSHEVENDDHGGSLYIKQIIVHMIQSKNSLCSPKVWVSLIHEIISSEPRRLMVDHDVGSLVSDTDDIEKGVQQSAKSSDTYSWQVKVFAMKCLKELLDAYKDDINHIDARTARDLSENNYGDFLVLHLSQIINTCSVALSKGTFSVRYAGLIVFLTILTIFEDVRDPDIIEESILQQHSIRFSTALAQGFEPKNPPMLTYAACELASAYIPSKMLINQPIQLSRMCSYLTDHLPKLNDLNSNQYGEIAATMIKVAILSTLASVYNNAEENSNTDLLTVLEPHTLLLFDLWGKALRDYAFINTVLEDASTEYVSANEDPSKPGSGTVHFQGTFLEEGTEKSVHSYFRRAYPSIINAITRMSSRQYRQWKTVNEQNAENTPFEYDYDVPLAMGVAVRSLYDNKINENTMSTIISCIQALTRIVPSTQFLSLPFAPGATFELFLLLIKMQSRDLRLQYACLKLLNTIVNEINVGIFGSSDQISTQAIVTTSTEVCLKPLRLHFPLLFEQDSEQSRVITISKEQLRLVKQCMSCLKTIVQRFRESVNGASVTTILFSICRILQYTKSSSCLEVAIAMSELEIQSSSISTLDETSVWITAFEAAIENLRLRIQDLKLTTYLEVELLFICLACVQKSLKTETNEMQLVQLASIHQSVIESFVGLLTDPQCLSMSSKVRKLGWVLHGLQNGLIRLAKSSYADLAAFYMSQLCGPLCTYLLRLFESGRVTNDQFEKLSDRVNSPTPDEGEDSELILGVVPAGLNILLAGYSMIEVGKRISFMHVMIPLLVALLRSIRTQSAISPEPKRRDNLDKIHKLAVQCLERIAQSAEQFTIFVRSLPPNIVQEIQQEVKKGKEKENSKPVVKAPPKHKKLQINFDAYVKK